MGRSIWTRRWMLVLVVLALGMLPAMASAAPQADEAGGVSWPGPYLALDYSPYRNGQAPWGPYPSREEIAQDLTAIAQGGIQRIRIYSAAGQVAQDILAEAAARSMKVALGASITAGQYGEVADAVALAKAYPQTVELLVIGNETQAPWSATPVPLADLIAQIQAAKTQTGLPVTTAEYASAWITGQGSLGGAVDVIWLQSYPYWNGACIGNALSDTAYYYGQMTILFPNKPVILGETGWPTGGAANGCAQPSVANQTNYISRLAVWAKQNQVVVYAFEFADEAWKGAPGTVETFWGLHKSDRTSKPAWEFYTIDPATMTERTYLPIVRR